MIKKRLGLIIVFVCTMLFIPNVLAATGSVYFTGTNTIKVGKTTTIYAKIKSSGKIRGVDIRYSASGNIKVTKVSFGSFTKMEQNGKRYILYNKAGLGSGSTALAITVKGTKEGTGTVSVSNCVATISEQDTSCGSASYKITVKPAMTEEEKKAAEKAKAEAEKKAKEAAEKAAKEKAEREAKEKQAIKDAIALVEKAEKSLKEADYKTALSAVNALASGNEKKDLEKRLDTVRIKIEAGKLCKGNANIQPCDCNTGVTSNSTSWIILCIILFVCLIIETCYLIYKNMQKKYE